MCAVYDSVDQAYFTRECYTVTNSSGVYTSRDLLGTYDGQCPYFSNCALSAIGVCDKTDYAFSFVGRVGRVLAVDSATSTVNVTFNDGRTSYTFQSSDVKLESYLSMY